MSGDIKTHAPADPITAEIVSIFAPMLRHAMRQAFTEAKVKLIASGMNNTQASNQALSVMSQLAATAMLAATEELALVIKTTNPMDAFNLMRIDIVRRAELIALRVAGDLMRKAAEESEQDNSNG